MSRLFILVSENLTQSRRLNIDEAVIKLSKTYGIYRNSPEIAKRTLLDPLESGTVFELEYHPVTGSATSILTVLDIE